MGTDRLEARCRCIASIKSIFLLLGKHTTGKRGRGVKGKTENGGMSIWLVSHDLPLMYLHAVHQVLSFRHLHIFRNTMRNPALQIRNAAVIL